MSKKKIEKKPAKSERLTIQTCVRFTPEDWAKVMKLADMRKALVAELLRACVLEEYSRNRPR